MGSKKREESEVELPKFDPKEGEVMTFKSYYYLYRKTGDGKHLVLRKDFRKGWYGFEVPEKELTKTSLDAWMINGHSYSPFTAAELEEFRGMTDEQLSAFLKK